MLQQEQGHLGLLFLFSSWVSVKLAAAVQGEGTVYAQMAGGDQETGVYMQKITSGHVLPHSMATLFFHLTEDSLK